MKSDVLSQAPDHMFPGRKENRSCSLVSDSSINMLALALYVLFTLSTFSLAAPCGSAQMPTTEAPMAAPSGMVGAPNMSCTQQWECDLPNITDDYNFAQCVDSICICRSEQVRL